MPEMHLRQSRLTYSACRPLTRNEERIRKFKETGDSWYIYQNELDKACFQNDLAYRDFKDLTRKPASNKNLNDKSFNIAKNLKYNGCQRGLASMVYTFFDKKTSGSGIKNENISNKELPEELHKLIIRIIRKFKKRKVHSSFIDNIWGAEK